jgi:hypothetical protein
MSSTSRPTASCTCVLWYRVRRSVLGSGLRLLVARNERHLHFECGLCARAAVLFVCHACARGSDVLFERCDGGVVVLKHDLLYLDRRGVVACCAHGGVACGLGRGFKRGQRFSLSVSRGISLRAQRLGSAARLLGVGQRAQRKGALGVVSPLAPTPVGSHLSKKDFAVPAPRCQCAPE